MQGVDATPVLSCLVRVTSDGCEPEELTLLGGSFYLFAKTWGHVIKNDKKKKLGSEEKIQYVVESPDLKCTLNPQQEEDAMVEFCLKENSELII